MKVLSVSVAAYNVSAYIRECLDCFLEASVLDRCEVIVVDDGSKDDTAIIVQEYVDKYPDTFKLVQKENGGWGSTLNTSIPIATGKYFRQLDGDDFLNSEQLKEFLDLLETTDADVVDSYYREFRDGTYDIIGTITTDESIPRERKLKIDEVSGRYDIAMHMFTFKTKILQRNNIRMAEHCFYTDVEFIIKAFSRCETIIFTELVVYMYRLGRDGQSMSIDGFIKHYKEHTRVIEIAIDYIENTSGILHKDILRTRIVSMISMQYIILLMMKPSKENKERFTSFDKIIKKYPYYYKRNTGRHVDLTRRTGYLTYWISSKYLSMKNDRSKKEKGIFLNV